MMEVVAPLKAPFPYFGGKSGIGTRSSHPLSVCDSLFFWIAGGFGCFGVASLAFNLKPIRSASVSIEVCDWLYAFALTALLLCYFGAVAVFVLRIFAVSIPAKICEGVVGFVVVWIVASFHASRFWTNKCFQHKLVNKAGNVFPIAIKIYAAVSALIATNGKQPWLPSLPGSTSISALAFSGPNQAGFIG